MELFEKASRSKYRFKVSNGVITTEDLWDLPLEKLDDLARVIRKEIKETGDEESLIRKTSTVNKVLQNKYEIIKYIIETKLSEREKRDLLTLKRVKKEQLENLIAQKELSSLESTSIEELKKELAKLDLETE